MGRFKDKLFSFGSKSKKPEQSDDQRITFVVPDRESLTAASKSLSKVRIPVMPQLRTLGNAYTFGQDLVRKFRREKIKIIEQDGLSREEAYRTNEKTLTHLVEERNAIADVIEKMIHPVIKVVAGVTVQIDDLYRGVFDHEQRIREIERMMRDAFGKAPEIPKLPGGKEVWQGNLKEAALKVIAGYRADSGADIRQYRSLRDASDQFLEKHIFVHKPGLTGDAFYENVKKAQGN